RSHSLHMFLRPETGAFCGAVAVYVFFWIFAGSHGFVTVAGTAGWLDAASELGIVVAPVAALMIAGEFDLSVGSVIGLSQAVVGLGTTHFGVPVWACIAIAVMGAAVV